MTTKIHTYINDNQLKLFLKNFINKNNFDQVLVQIFAHEKDLNKIESIYNTIKTSILNVNIIGCISKVNISNPSLITENTIISFTALTNIQLETFCYELKDTAISDFNSIIESHISKYNVNILYTDINLSYNSKLLKGIKSNNNYILGAVLFPHEKGTIIYKGKLLSNSIIGFSFNNKNITFKTNSYNNYISIGKDHLITNAHNNEIISIDHMIARDFYKKYLGKIDDNKIEQFIKLFPLLLKNKNHSQSIFVKNITKHGTMIVDSNVKIGDLVSIGYNKLKKLIETPNKNIKNIIDKLNASLMLFTNDNINKSINYTLTSNYPIFGLLTKSQFEVNKDKLIISKSCFNILSFLENSISTKNLNNDPYLATINENTALLNLVDKTSKELNILNQTLENLVTQKTNELLKHYYKDDLTNLPNLNQLIENINNNKAQSIALIDISSFIDVNIFYGNHIGNQLLIHLAKLITEFCKDKQWIPYRIYSDIFAVTSSKNNFENFNTNIKTLQKLIHQHSFLHNSLNIYITTVVAVSHNNKNLYEKVSMTLEYAKSNKKPFLIYDESLNIEKSIENNLIWTTKIRKAIENDKIVPFYQPIYNNITKTVDHYEALMRLIDEDGTIYTPYHFLEISKKANIYKTLTKIIIDKTFDDFRDLDYHFSINISSEDMLDEQVCNYIYNKLSVYPKAEQVIFEIVESESIDNYEQVKNFINNVKSYGASIAIDDFGTGFSNFHYLFKLKVDLIKIDGSIIKQITEEKAASLVAETIVDFAKKMNILTVAEFVSNEHIFNKALNMGINYAQGYYISVPKENIV